MLKRASFKSHLKLKYVYFLVQCYRLWCLLLSPLENGYVLFLLEFVSAYLLFLPQHHLDPVHRHHDADLLLLDVLGLEFILRKQTKRSTSEYWYCILIISYLSSMK